VLGEAFGSALKRLSSLGWGERLVITDLQIRDGLLEVKSGFFWCRSLVRSLAIGPFMCNTPLSSQDVARGGVGLLPRPPGSGTEPFESLGARVGSRTCHAHSVGYRLCSSLRLQESAGQLLEVIGWCPRSAAGLVPSFPGLGRGFPPSPLGRGLW
jgi:hypothetical protein